MMLKSDQGTKNGSYRHYRKKKYLYYEGKQV